MTDAGLSINVDHGALRFFVENLSPQYQYALCNNKVCNKQYAVLLQNYER